MDYEMKAMVHDLEYLIVCIEDANRITWEVTTEGPVEADHEHCMICTDIINRGDQEHKVRYQGERKYRRVGQAGELTKKWEAFLCWYCYERFIKNNGIEDLKKMLK